MKRFYKTVAIAAQDGGWRVTLDGRSVKTQGRREQVVPTEALARALAAEWEGQGDEIDPQAFRLRDLTDYTLDAIADAREETVDALLPYAETDTLCYREPREPLASRQEATWEPLLEAAERRYDVHFVRVRGVMHQPQHAETLARMRTVLAAQSDFALAALRSLTNLSASLVIALAALEPGADAAALWDAANLEEDFQAEQWGEDAEALERRTGRFASFKDAMRLAQLARA